MSWNVSLLRMSSGQLESRLRLAGCSVAARRITYREMRFGALGIEDVAVLEVDGERYVSTRASIFGPMVDASSPGRWHRFLGQSTSGDVQYVLMSGASGEYGYGFRRGDETGGFCSSNYGATFYPFGAQVGGLSASELAARLEQDPECVVLDLAEEGGVALEALSADAVLDVYRAPGFCGWP